MWACKYNNCVIIIPRRYRRGGGVGVVRWVGRGGKQYVFSPKSKQIIGTRVLNKWIYGQIIWYSSPPVFTLSLSVEVAVLGLASGVIGQAAHVPQMVRLLLFWTRDRKWEENLSSQCHFLVNVTTKSGSHPPTGVVEE